jgi:hypothetical protein
LSASDGDARSWVLNDFPVVLMSYDEPWADLAWLDLKSRFRHVVRVHGVKGLDACHKAAAAAVPGDWVVTVDADTRVGPALPHAPVPQQLLTGNYRLDWLAENAVNGVVSGNGCVKLWPKSLIAEMRTHEAAPEGSLSLDHDIAGIRAGLSAQVTMPLRAARTDPAATAFHAFRAGLRETAFLRNLAENSATRRGADSWLSDTGLLRLIEVWTTVGRHAPNGPWMLYGARLGLALRDSWPDWDPARVNDHDSLRVLWSDRIAPRYQRGPTREDQTRGDAASWDWPAVERDLAGLAETIAARGGPQLAEVDAARSAPLAACGLLSTPVTPARIDALGYRMLTAARTQADRKAAQAILAQAAVQDHPAAHFNLATLAGTDAAPPPARTDWHLAVAARLGNAAAAQRSAGRRDGPQVATADELPVLRADAKALIPALRRLAGQACLILDPGVTLLPLAARHVPDLDLLSDGHVLGYLSLCPISGLPRPRGVRLAVADRLLNRMVDGKLPPADAVLPVTLGQLPAPTDAEAALRGGLADGGRDLAPALWTLGLDLPHGDHWVLGVLLSQTDSRPDPDTLPDLAHRPAAEIAADITTLSQRVSRQRQTVVPVWSAADSRAIRRLMSPVPARAAWLAAATALSGLSGLSGLGSPATAAHAAAHAAVLATTADTIWGTGPGIVPSIARRTA